MVGGSEYSRKNNIYVGMNDTGSDFAVADAKKECKVKVVVELERLGELLMLAL